MTFNDDPTLLEGAGDDSFTEADEALFYEWVGDQVDFTEAMLERGRSYGSYVLTDRALPDVRDGLKPVQRRIIITMNDLGFRADRKYAKSAKTVGNVIADYHPHGDAAVYTAMVRMAQDWQSSLPLIDGQGNWGNLHDEAIPAAQRYTECRLSAAASEFLSDIRPEIIGFGPNFDETKQMPLVLPVTFPNLLVNGSYGIGWAMACSIPPHNLAEVISAALLVLDDPDVSTDRLLKAMPGPDLPGGGVVVNPENLRQIYQTGRGTVMVQGRIEQVPGQPILRITELPYQVSAKSIVEKTVEAAKTGKINEIYTAELPKNLTDASGLDIQIKCKRGGSIAKLTEELIIHTKLRDTLAFNFTVLVDGRPKTVGLREMLAHFVEFRKDVVTKRFEYERAVLLKRLHLLLAEKGAADAIDRVISIVRNAKDDDDSKAKLIAELKYKPHRSTRAVPIDDLQAQHIIDMALKRINALNRFRIREEIQTKSARVDEITAILESADGVRGIVRDELKAIRKKYAQPRRTIIPTENVAAALTDLDSSPSAIGAAVEDVWVWLTSTGSGLVTARSQKLPTSAPIRMGDTETLISVIAASSEMKLLVFTEQGQAIRVSLGDQPISRSGPGKTVVTLSKGDAVAAAFAGPESAYYLLVSEGGQIKRIPAQTIEKAAPTGVFCCRVPDEDRIIAAVPHGENDEILIAKAGGQILRIETSTKLRPVATGAAGMITGIKLETHDNVVSAVVADGLTLVTFHETGMALSVALSDYPLKGRGTGGVQSVQTDKPTKHPAGDACLIACQSTSPLLVFTDKGTLHEIPQSTMPPLRRSTASRPCLNLGPGETPIGTVAL
jgi:DNA gyrase subunit A